MKLEGSAALWLLPLHTHLEIRGQEEEVSEGNVPISRVLRELRGSSKGDARTSQWDVEGLVGLHEKQEMSVLAAGKLRN